MSIPVPLNTDACTAQQMPSGFVHSPGDRNTGPRSSILDTIGNTQVAGLNKIGPTHVEFFAKLESFNPLGSVKDRAALSIVEDAETTAKGVLADFQEMDLDYWMTGFGTGDALQGVDRGLKQKSPDTQLTCRPTEPVRYCVPAW